ncbi:hypothetical protein [Flavobacterium cerinum]|uniref:Uncharacterized protein n=1 Tax=Flavobacterium cerinum TaxID=2502784 RepID=A0ABY5IXA0_9FLAO|nr:hypothetical protein [Flavobacterium cerinum]UUC45979.1 hypothetical protein NOX80_01960 [Flavobacterium cerinum]
MSKYNMLEAQGKQAYLAALDEIGWFDLPQNDRSKIEAKINESNGDFYLSLHHLTFLAEDFETEDGFKDLIATFQTITGIRFQSVDFDFNEDKMELKIIAKTDTQTITTWVDMSEYPVSEVEGILNEIINEIGMETHFVWLPLESEILFYVFVPHELYMKAVKKGIIPQDDYYINGLYDEYNIDESQP